MSDKYLVISADCHAGLPADQYRAYVDPKFRDTYDEFVAAAENMRNARMGPSESRDAWVAEWREEIEDHGGMRGSWDANVRDKELDGDGVACEVIFPDADAAGVGGVSGTPFGAGLGLVGRQRPRARDGGAKAHNRWLAELCADEPGTSRRRGAGADPARPRGGHRGDRVGRRARAPWGDDPDPLDRAAGVQRRGRTTRCGPRASTTRWCCTRTPAPDPPTSASGPASMSDLRHRGGLVGGAADAGCCSSRRVRAPPRPAVLPSPRTARGGCRTCVSAWTRSTSATTTPGSSARGVPRSG